jgi:molecular chaperone IbpA
MSKFNPAQWPHESWDKNPDYKRPPEWDKKPVPKVITINDVFPMLDRLSIGWSPLLNDLKKITATKPAYPPYDLISPEEDVNLLKVAVAGFSKDEISVEVQESVITITGKKKDKAEGEIIYQGIAARDFELKLAIAEYWNVTNAALDNGMLTVTFERELPEEKKPKTIEIN